MYRKKLMRVALAGIMTATVITSSVPVNAAEPVAAKQEETTKSGEPGASADITVKFVDERGNVVLEKKLSFEEGVYNYSILEQYLPEGYEMKTSGDFRAVNGATIEARVMQKAPEVKEKTVKINYYDEAAKKQVAEVSVKVSDDAENVDKAIVTKNIPEGYTLSGRNATDCVIRDGYVYVSVSPVEKTQTVKINYYDEAAKKQVAEVPVEVSIDTSAVNMAIITRNMPAGYVLSGENGSDCQIRDGYVYVSVAPQEKTQTVKINYYDEAAKKQVAEVPVEVSIDTSAVNMAIITRHMPAGYGLSAENASDCIIRDGYVYVSVSPVEETQTVKINYYDETAEKQVAEVPVQGSVNTSSVNKAILARFMPAGYTLVDSDCQIRDGYVYVSVKEDITLREATLTVTFETTDGTVVDKTVCSKTGKDGEDATFKLGEDFNLPAGYKVSNDRDQVTEISIPFGSVGGHTMVVEKAAEAETREINLVYYNAKNGENIANVPLTVGAADTQVHVENVKKYVPEGWELAFVKAADIDANGIARIAVTQKPVETKEVHLVYFNVENDENISDAVITVGALDKDVHVENVRQHVPAGWELARENDFAIDENNNVKVPVKRLSAPEEASKDINIIYYDHKTNENYRNVVVSVDKDATEMDAAYVRRNLPEGYAIVDEDGRFPIEADGTTRVAVAKATDWTPIEPSTPVEKPEKPEEPNKPSKPETPNKDENKDDNKKDDKKDDKKKAPKTSDEANPLAAAVPAGLSLAAILALLVKKFK